MGFFISQYRGHKRVAHGGYQNAFKTHLYLEPQTRTAYLIAYNTYVAPTKEDPDIDTDRLDVTS